MVLLDFGNKLSLLVGNSKVLIWNTSGRPKSPKRGTLGYNSETKNLEFYNGFYWLTTEMLEP